MNENDRYLSTWQKVAVLTAIISLLSISNTLADFNGFGTAFEGGRGLLYMQTARTYGKGRYVIGVQSLSMNRKYWNQWDNDSKDDYPVILGFPLTYGLTDNIDISAGFYFQHGGRPYFDKEDFFKFYGSPITGLSATRLGLKARLPLSEESKIQLAGKFAAILTTSKDQLDGMNYRYTRSYGDKTSETDIEFSLLESFDLHQFVSLHLEQGYVFSGSEIFDNQIVIGVGLDIHPLYKLTLGLELNNRTFNGVSPQSIINAIHDPNTYWKNAKHFGDPKYVEDSDLDFMEDFLVVAPSVSYLINDNISINAGALVNLADQKGLRETAQFAIGINLH